jgi:predicted nuclease of predicted toxin-antitoxin system
LPCWKSLAEDYCSQSEVRILLDENLDWRLRRDLPGHQVESVPLIGWAGLRNGTLLAEAEKRFDVLLTMDSNMVHQQNQARFRIAVIALQARSNRLADTRPLTLKVLAALSSARPGALTVVT